MSKELRIDPEFQALLPSLSDDERSRLEASLLADGCRESLIAWNGTLVDGHNRYTLCRKHGIAYEVEEKDFADRDAAMDWMDNNQLGRRNLKPDARRLALGRLYNRQKRNAGRPTCEDKCDQNDHNTERTAETIAREHGVSAPTVRRAGKFAEEVESDPELREAVSQGKSVRSVKKEREKSALEQEIDGTTPSTKAGVQHHGKIDTAKCGIGLDRAERAIQWLEEIPDNDRLLHEAMENVIGYCEKRKAT